MKLLIKRALVLMLTLLMIGSVSFAEPDSDGNNTLLSATTKVEPALELAFNRAFDVGNNVATDVNYSYQLIEDEIRNVAEISLNINILVGNNKYPIHASGYATPFKLENGRSMYIGCLRGNSKINNTDYNILIGLHKLQGQENIFATVNMNPINDKGAEKILFTFGDPIVTTNDISYLLGKDVYEFIGERKSPSAVQSHLPSTEDDITQLSSSFYLHLPRTVPFPAPISAPALNLKCYLSHTYDRIALSLQSYNTNVMDYYNSIYEYSGSAVYQMRVALQRIGEAGYIAGIDDLNIPPSGYGSMGDIVQDAISQLPNGSWFITLLNVFKTTVSYNVLGAHTYVDWDFGPLSTADFDSVSCGVPPVIFQLADLPKTSYWTGYADMTYYVAVYFGQGGWGWFFEDAPRNTLSITYTK